MQQSTAALPAPLTTRHGALSITSSRTVEGGFAINTYAGTTSYRHDELSFTTPDQATAVLARQVITDGGEAFKSPEEIRAALTDALTNELHLLQRRHDTPSQARITHLNALLDVVDPVLDEALRQLTEQVVPRARSFADFKRLHDEAVQRDRRERAARKAVA
jgi:hypothetical protein